MEIEEKRCLDECYEKLTHSDFTEHYRITLKKIMKKLQDE